MAAAGPGLEGRPFDSFGGKAFKIALPAGGALTTFVAHDLLTPGSHGFPPFGANGTQLFIANTADDRILKYDVALKTVTVFAESINGADGIARCCSPKPRVTSRKRT